MKKVKLKVNYIAVKTTLLTRASSLATLYHLILSNIKVRYLELKNYIKIAVTKTKVKAVNSVNLYKPKAIRNWQLAEFWVSKQFFTFPKYVGYRYQVLIMRYGSYVFFTFYFSILFIFVGMLGYKYDLILLGDMAASLFIGAAAMIGASIAIVATFGQFTIQYAAEKLPKNFYNVAINMKKYFAIFWCLCGVTFGLFLEGLLYGKLHLGLAELSIQIGLLLLGTSFYLIYILFITVINDVNPNNILKRVKRNIDSTTKMLFERTKGYAEVMLLHPDNRNQYDLNQALVRLYQENAVKEQLNYFVSNAEFLFDYHDQLFYSHQVSNALEVLGIIESLVLNYIDIRKDSSIAVPNQEALMVFSSDSEHILQPILERMRGLCAMYMVPNNTAGIQKIIGVFQNWATKASEVTYVGLAIPENPILERVTGYFNFIVENAKSTKSMEFMFQGGYFYRHVLGISIDKNYIHIFSSCLDQVKKLGIKALELGQDGTIKQVYDVYDFILLKAITSNSPMQDNFFRMTVDDLEKVTLLICSVRNTKAHADTYVVQQYVAKPFNTLRELIGVYAHNAVQETDDKKRGENMEKVLWLQEEYQRLLRGIARNLKNPNHFIITSLAPDIRAVGLILLKLSENPDLLRYKDKLVLEARLFAVLPEFFIDQGKNVENEKEIDYIVDAISSVGLQGLTIDAKVVGEGAVDSLGRMAMRILENSATMYVESNVMEHACYLGILANKKGADDIVSKLKPVVLDFMEKYKTKHYSNVPEGINPYDISPPPDKLRRDLAQLASERESWAGRNLPRMGIYETKEDLFEQVTVEDITNFINKVWGS